jgi:aminopeptidase
MAEGRRELMGKYIDKMMLPERSVTVTLHPTAALAQDAAMSLIDYERFVYGALLVHDSDPVALWQELAARQRRIADWLQTKSSITIAGPNAEITFGVNGRGWISDDGHKNYPGGEIFTSPIEDAVDGHIRFTYPAIYSGREARDVQLWFESGKVVRAEAANGADFLHQMLDLDEGARRLGELAIGTNKGVTTFTGNILFDEKIAGTCHLAIGRGFPNIGSKNSSAIHWDMVCDLKQDSTISADGEVFYRDGDFVI